MPQGRLKASIPMKCMDQTPPTIASAPGNSQASFPVSVVAFRMRSDSSMAMNEAKMAVNTDTATSDAS